MPNLDRRTHAQLLTEVRRLVGEVDPELSDDLPDTRITELMNTYMQSLSQRVSDLLAAQGAPISVGNLKLPMWRQEWASSASSGDATLLVTSGGSTIDFPTDMDVIESLYDTVSERELHRVKEVRKFPYLHKKLLDKPVGPPEAYEITGYVTSNTHWVAQATLYPSTVSGVTPSLTLTGFRLPTQMPGTDTSTEYLDIDTKYEYLPVLGTVVSILRPDDPQYETFKKSEQEELMQLARTAVRI